MPMMPLRERYNKIDTHYEYGKVNSERRTRSRSRRDGSKNSPTVSCTARTSRFSKEKSSAIKNSLSTEVCVLFLCIYIFFTIDYSFYFILS